MHALYVSYWTDIGSLHTLFTSADRLLKHRLGLTFLLGVLTAASTNTVSDAGSFCHTE